MSLNGHEAGQVRSQGRFCGRKRDGHRTRCSADRWCRARLPIFIGLWEAVSINSAYNKEVPPRPFTHDLFLALMERFSITVHHLRIDSEEEGVYYAQLVLATDGRNERLDCRPSDGIAVALRRRTNLCG